MCGAGVAGLIWPCEGEQGAVQPQHSPAGEKGPWLSPSLLCGGTECGLALINHVGLGLGDFGSEGEWLSGTHLTYGPEVEHISVLDHLNSIQHFKINIQTSVCPVTCVFFSLKIYGSLIRDFLVSLPTYGMGHHG